MVMKATTLLWHARANTALCLGNAGFALWRLPYIGDDAPVALGLTLIALLVSIAIIVFSLTNLIPRLKVLRDRE